MVEEVDDQFQLVHALEVRDLGLITRFDEGVEAGFHQRGYTPTEHRLFAEEVRLGFLRKGRLQYAGPGTAESFGICERVSQGAAGGILMHGHQRGYASALREDLAHAMAG